MKNIVGQIASKEDFYPRKKEMKRIHRVLLASGNMQLSAPRRVGKSSILVALKDNPLDGFHFIYVDVESARDLQSFYRKIYQAILTSDLLNPKRKAWEQIKNGTNRFFSRLKNITIGGLGEIQLNDELKVDYEEEIAMFFYGLDLENTKLVIMIDEFPEVILNIVHDQNGDLTQARHFLQSNRTLRNHENIRGRILFIYTGSSSLNSTAEFLNSTELINDITSIPVNPLSQEEASDLTLSILNEYGYRIDNERLAYLLSSIEWLIPFYIQLMVHEIINQIDEDEEITSDVIDIALNEISSRRNNHHFEHYSKRLSRLFSDNHYKFIRQLLSHLCRTEKLNLDEIINIGHGTVSQEEIIKILDNLCGDGYIINCNDNPIEYKFVSSILKNWWYKHDH